MIVAWRLSGLIEWLFSPAKKARAECIAKAIIKHTLKSLTAKGV
jgi:hypothetical protein